ncbi:MAG: RluA family pseudouridine synthase [Natronincolaceae bacterium]|jgi:23S rRNA pseudouridine1911/1915/1917 synthase|nr:RNA pseudouridine synthase [Bacillota bacterium]NLK90015.1 RNA pseudouridine synthase [Clostridiales bacterium]
MNIDIPIIFEDNHLLVVEKPPNVLSQGDKTGDLDMLTLLKRDIKLRYNKPGNVYLGLVHRLDRPVGGVMVFAKTSKAASRLSDQIRRRKFERRYMAVIHGRPRREKATLVHYLLKDNETNTVSVVKEGAEGAKKAILSYEIIDTIRGFSLVKTDLHTGRSHQIRVQFSAIGHPLYGDQLYNPKKSKIGDQIALRSHEIVCIHPTLKKEMTFTCLPVRKEPWDWF